MRISLSEPPRKGATPSRLAEGTTIKKIVGAGVTGMVSFVAAVFTIVVEPGGFWQYLCLGACILLFVCSASLAILASREWPRIDHAELRFEPWQILLAEQKWGSARISR
jgi:hypothetical protein